MEDSTKKAKKDGKNGWEKMGALKPREEKISRNQESLSFPAI